MTNNIVRIGGLFEIDSTRKQNAISEYKAVQVALKHVNENRVLDEYMLDMVSNDSKSILGHACSSSLIDNETCSNIVIKIGSLFDIDGRRPDWMGFSELIAAKIAEKHFNEASKNYKIELLVNDSKCDPGVATDALLDLIYRKPQILMVMGGACSEVTETLAELSPYWNLILVSYASTSPALSEREKYKTFFRLASTDSSNNPARELFIQHFRWDTVATIYENKEMFYLAIDGLAKILEENKITIKRSVSFNTKETEISSKILELQAYKHGMFGSRFVWILIKETVERWWEASNDTECTVAELQLATEGYFIVTSLNTFNNNQMSVSNITADKFLTDYKSINGTVPLSPYATSAYDTVWTMALTIKETLRHWKENSSSHNISQFDYDDGEYIMADLRRVMQNLSFDGLSMRSFMFAAGFSLAFGSMFTKTYRVHQIFTRAHSGLIKSKIYCIVMAKGAPVIASSGILVEDKTRRFIVNDKREVYYRAEVQNRVYKREIIELEQEITRLERLLEQPLEPYPKMTPDLMKVLPETRIDSLSPTQDITRRIRRRSIIVNGEEVSLDGFGSDSSDSSSSDSDTIASGNIVQPFANRRNPLRMSIKNAAASTARRLSLWRKAITEKHNREKPNANNLQQRNQLTLDIKKPKRTNLENDISISDNLQVPSIVSYSHLDDMNPRQKWRIMLTPESESEDVIEITSISPDMSIETCIAEDTESRIVRANLLKGEVTPRRIDRKDELLSFLLLNERRKRIQKLQTDIKHIHEELVNLEELEYVVSNV
ncbi:gamma-aminobutyric acid type B receptor [Mytilus galloprovincialis]|uniref:Gamma-aminobutyric acid type B receptor n=1 Tax=Mytilus galloprovincialis TaxID=29158 RepID=A0A8B6HE76_MYTGA|nr:gamma-aminobutyric acid type B receptor [Mytilus galloprovincialis]